MGRWIMKKMDNEVQIAETVHTLNQTLLTSMSTSPPTLGRSNSKPVKPNSAKLLTQLDKKAYRIHFKEMKEHTQTLLPELEVLKELANKLSSFQSKTYDSLVFDLVEKRLNRSSLRAHFARQVYAYYLGTGISKPTDPKLFEVHIPFILEGLIIVQYLQNQIYDGKNGIFHHDAIRGNIIAANKLKELLTAYVDECITLSRAKKAKLREAMHQIVIAVDDGQAFEAQYNTFKTYQRKDFDNKKIKKLLNEKVPAHILKHLTYYQPTFEELKIQSNGHSYVDIYSYRIMMTNSMLFVIGAEIIGELLGVAKAEIRRVSRFAAGFGQALQIVNDNADYVYKVLGLEKDKQGEVKDNCSIGKVKEDVHCDLRNQVVTLPLLCHLFTESWRQPKSYLRKILLTHLNRKELIVHPALVLKEMIESQALKQAVRIGRLTAVKALDMLDANNPKLDRMQYLIQIAYWNKYYYAIEKFEQNFRRDETGKFCSKELHHNLIWMIERGKYRCGDSKRRGDNQANANQISLFA